MAELQASYIQASSHPADTDRLVLEGLMNPAGAPVSGAAYGVGQGSTELKVQAKGTPNMSVDVLAGHGWIDGTEGANQGTYHVYNDATKNLVISAAHATLARKDLVVAKVQDAAYSGAVNAWSLAVVTGTPASPALEPAVPANAIVLALVDVAALAASIVNGNITDRRRRASGLGGIVVCTSATRPAAPYTGQVIYETDTDRPMVWDGSSWKQLGLKYDPPACCATMSAPQTINDNTTTTINFNAENYDTPGTMHDNVTNNSRITMPIPGLYLFTADGALSDLNDYQAANFVLRGNGVTTLAQSSDMGVSDGGGPKLNLSTVEKLVATDYVELRVFFNNTANTSRTITAKLTATWIGRG